MLQNADPTGEIEKDPAELVTYEDQCHKVNAILWVDMVFSSTLGRTDVYSALFISLLDGTTDRHRIGED